MAWAACIKLQKIWNSKIPSAAKLKFFKACVAPILLYSSETINKAFQKRTPRRQLHPPTHESPEPFLEEAAHDEGNLRQPPTYIHCSSTEKSKICGSLHAGSGPTDIQSPTPATSTNIHERRPLTYTDIVARDVQLPVEEMQVAMLGLYGGYTVRVHCVSTNAM